MRVLIACEFSGIVRDEFLRKGHSAISCDLLPTESAGPHLQCDVRDVLFKSDWDLIIAFPPCTHLAASGAKHFEKKIADGRQQQGVDFFMLFTNIDCPRVAIENPVGIMSRLYRKPNQYIQPYEFGDKSRKKTCLWLKGLPNLVSTKIVLPELKSYTVKGGRVVTFSKDYLVGLNGESGKKRSKTYPGIAKAMADQWGCNHVA